MPMTAEEKIKMILEWADEEKPEFDTGFVESLQDQLEKKDFLTDAQEEALDNIIDKWGIIQ